MESKKVSNGFIALIVLASIVINFGIWMSTAFTTLIAIGVFAPTEPSPVTAITVGNKDLHVDAGAEVEQYFTVTATGTFSENDLKFISADETVATVKFKKISMTNYVYFTVSGLKPGVTQISFENGDGTVVSDKITVTVTGTAPAPSTDTSDKVSSSTASTTDTTPTDTATTDSATQNASTDTQKPASTSTQKPASTSTQKPASTSTQAPASTQTSDTGTTSDKVSDTPSSGGAVIVPDNNQNEVVYVWIPNYENGKYHRTSDCSRMKSPIKVTLEEAIRLGFGPCQQKKCYG